MSAAQPCDLDALSFLIRQNHDRMTFVAGGTDLIIARKGDRWPGLTIDISRPDGLKEIEAGPIALRIGAGVSMATLTTDPVVARGAPMLAQAAVHVGSVQIRNRATLGGNIASALPAADLLPVLQCLGARVEILRRYGQKELLDLDQVVLGRGKPVWATAI